jgi:hypothetical protein
MSLFWLRCIHGIQLLGLHGGVENTNPHIGDYRRRCYGDRRNNGCQGECKRDAMRIVEHEPSGFEINAMLYLVASILRLVPLKSDYVIT